jgi:uncharacterized protein YqeY
MYCKINKELKQAMLDHNGPEVATLRLLKSSIINAAIEKKKKPEEFSDLEVIGIVRKEIKKCEDSIEGFKLDNRQDSINKELAALEVLSQFVPKPLDSAELNSIIDNVIIELNATTKKDMGRVMKAVNEKVAGRMDGKTISSIVNSKLV